MSLHNTAWLILSIFLLTGGVAQSRDIGDIKPFSAKTNPAKEWRDVDGFRSAKFGMNEKQVMQAIFKDFNASKKQVQRNVNFSEGTPQLSVKLNNLLIPKGISQVIYTLGYKSKSLIQVDILWGSGLSKKVDYNLVMASANILRSYFLKKKTEKD